MPPSDPYNLTRFLLAQEEIYDSALSELRSARKRSHWMWYIFPQLEGLGSSPTSRHYAIKSAEEARAYLDHPTLGPRLTECAQALLAIPNRSAHDILGSPDDLKLQSSATLFAAISPPASIFERLLDHYFAGERDPQTLRLLEESR